MHAGGTVFDRPRVLFECRANACIIVIERCAQPVARSSRDEVCPAMIWPMADVLFSRTLFRLDA